MVSDNWKCEKEGKTLLPNLKSLWKKDAVKQCTVPFSDVSIPMHMFLMCAQSADLWKTRKYKATTMKKLISSLKQKR